MKNKGFSLVELIVVIAIMAILVGVAVPVYTGYIEKAQKSKDEQLVDEIKHAVEIALIGNPPASFGGGVVITLSENGAEVSGGSEDDQNFVKTALSNTFGTAWATDLALSYDGWESGTAQTVIANYVGSSFDGNEEKLLGQIQNLANMLSIAAENNPNLIGDAYADFLSINQLTGVGTAAGNAAVLYVADSMVKDMADEDFDKDAFATAMAQAAMGDGTRLTQLFSGKSKASLAAATYASYEAMFQYMANNGYSKALDAWHSVKYENIATPEDALTAIGTAANSAKTAMQNETDSAGALTAMQNYFAFEADGNTIGSDAQAKKDALAYLSTMTAISESEDALLNNVGKTDCYTDGTLLSKMQAYIAVGSAQIEAGEVAIIINGSANGSTSVVIYPLEY